MLVLNPNLNSSDFSQWLLHASLMKLLNPYDSKHNLNYLKQNLDYMYDDVYIICVFLKKLGQTPCNYLLELPPGAWGMAFVLVLIRKTQVIVFDFPSLFQKYIQVIGRIWSHPGQPRIAIMVLDWQFMSKAVFKPVIGVIFGHNNRLRS